MWDETETNEEEKENIKDTQKQENYLASDIDHETILLFGSPKVGKTYAACSLVDSTIKNKGKIHVINTDNGVKRTLKAYFKNDYNKIISHINYYHIDKIDDVMFLVKKIKAEVNRKDLIFIDLIDDFYEMAQTRFAMSIAESLGVDFVDYIVSASRDSAKFGLFDRQKWDYVKKLDGIIVDNLVTYPPCNVIACCGAKDIEVAKQLTKKESDKYELSKYDEIGYKPGGHKKLAQKFNTIVFISESRSGEHYFIVMGDRGFIKKSNKVTYTNFYQEFKKLRK